MSYNFQLGLTATGFLAGARSCAAALTSITRAGQGAASAVGRIGGAMTGALKGAGDMLFKLPEQMKAVQGMLSGLTAPLTLAASAESTATAFRVLVKDVGKADAALAAIRKLGDSTPFEFAELASAGRMLIGFGTDVGNVTDLLRRLGDMASAAQQPIGDIALIYGQVQAKGRLQAEEMLQLQERGIVITKELAQVLGVEEKQISKMMEQGKVSFGDFSKAVQMATNEGGKFHNMMSIMSETTEGKLSTLGDAWKALLVKIGTPVNDSLKGIIDAATNGLSGLSSTAELVGQKLAETIDFLRASFSDGTFGDLLLAQLEVTGLQFLNLITDGLEYAASKLGAHLMDAGIALADKVLGVAETLAELMPGGGAQAASIKAARAMAAATDLSGMISWDEIRGRGGAFREELGDAKGRRDGLVSMTQDTAARYQLDRKLSADEQRRKIEGKKEGTGHGAGGSLPEWERNRLEQKRLQATLDVSTYKWREFSKTMTSVWSNLTTKPAAPAAKPAVPAANAPAAGGAGTGTGTGTASPEGTGMGGLPRESSAGKAQMLLNRFRRQAGGEGRKGWQDFLNSGVSTSGLSEQQVSAMKRMGPEGLQAKLSQISRRKGVATTDGQAEGPIRPVLEMISKNTSETVAHLKAAREEAA